METKTAPAAAAVNLAADAKKFTDAFGDVGARWFCEGKSFEASATEFIATMKTNHAAEIAAATEKFTQLQSAQAGMLAGKDAEITQLKQRIEQAGNVGADKTPAPAATAGATAPASNGVGKSPEYAEELRKLEAKGITGNRARFIAGQKVKHSEVAEAVVASAAAN